MRSYVFFPFVSPLVFIIIIFVLYRPYYKQCIGRRLCLYSELASASVAVLWLADERFVLCSKQTRINSRHGSACVYAHVYICYSVFDILCGQLRDTVCHAGSLSDSLLFFLLTSLYLHNFFFHLLSSHIGNAQAYAICRTSNSLHCTHTHTQLHSEYVISLANIKKLSVLGTLCEFVRRVVLCVFFFLLILSFVSTLLERFVAVVLKLSATFSDQSHRFQLKTEVK